MAVGDVLVVVTDGEHLVVAEQPVIGGPRSELVAYALDDGSTVWRVPFPDGLQVLTFGRAGVDIYPLQVGVGLEDVEDLLADLDGALAAASA